MILYKVINFLQQHLWWMLLLFIVVLQIPFLQADPDIYLSPSRDAHTDEGLNTIQLRNYINHGYLDPWECDNLMKNPLFNLILLLPLKIFGTKLIVARLTVLFFVTGILFFIGFHKRWKRWLICIIPVVFLQFYVLQYMHFALAEMMAVGCIFMGMFTMTKMWDEENNKKRLFYLLVGLTSLMLCWYIKIQFIYIMFVDGTIVLIYLINDVIQHKKITKNFMTVAMTTLIHTLFFAALYYKFWYLHYKEPFEYIMQNQAGNRFATKEALWSIMSENYNKYFTNQFVKPLWIVFCMALPIGFWLWRKVKYKLYKRVFLFSFIWVLVEVHKMAIHHVPSRYLLSLLIAMMVLIGTVLYGLFNLKIKQKGKVYRWISIGYFIGIMILVISHLYNYSVILKRRSYGIYELTSYMRNYNDKNMVVIDPWAPTLTWNTQIRSLPVWKDFLNNKNIKNKFHPDIVVSEPEEIDSDGAFMADGFDIINEADSIKKTTIGRWPIHIYWMRK